MLQAKRRYLHVSRFTRAWTTGFRNTADTVCHYITLPFKILFGLGVMAIFVFTIIAVAIEMERNVRRNPELRPYVDAFWNGCSMSLDS
jgi:hypothetical protein